MMYLKSSVADVVLSEVSSDTLVEFARHTLFFWANDGCRASWEEAGRAVSDIGRTHFTDCGE